MKRIAVVADGYGGSNGLSTSHSELVHQLTCRGYDVLVLYPGMLSQSPASGIRDFTFGGLDMTSELYAKLEGFRPDYIYIATVIPLGYLVAQYCTERGLSFLAGFNTDMPEYFALIVKDSDASDLPLFLKPYARNPAALRAYLSPIVDTVYRGATRTLVPTLSMMNALRERGYVQLIEWSRGVDCCRFRPVAPHPSLVELEKPIMLYVGSVGSEKNVQMFVDMPLMSGTKVVVGAGVLLRDLRETHKNEKIVFLGNKPSDELPSLYSAADVFVFPGLRDVSPNVIREAIACGCPIAGFDAIGTRDMLSEPCLGIIAKDFSATSLSVAAYQALQLNREHLRDFASTHLSWTRMVDIFIDNLVPIHAGK